MGEPRLWTGGRVFTGSRYVEAVLVDQGRVVAAGSDREVRRSAPTGTELRELRGRLVLPGLVDAHLHVGDLVRSLDGVVLADVRGPEELLGRIRDWALLHPGETVVGRGLDVDRSLGGRWPTRTELDRVVEEDRPVVLYHVSGHAAVVNSAALSASGVESGSAASLPDRVGRGPDGTANGLLTEEALRSLGPLVSPSLGAEQMVRLLAFLASLGLTSVVSMNVAPEEIALGRSLAREGRLPIRIRCYARLLRLGELAAADLSSAGPSGRFAVVGAKGFVDGAFGPRTAWLSAPYADAPGTSGLKVESDEALSKALEEARDRGLAPALHAIGDRAVVRAARLLAPYRASTGPRARIEHVGLASPEVLSELEGTGLGLVVQPGFVWSDSWLAERLGAERARWAYPFRTLADRGHLLVGSSDAPYDPVDPWRGIRAATERRDESGRSANPDPREALSIEEAFRLYGANAGTLLGEPDLGTLEAGGRADLVVLGTSSLEAAIRVGARALLETWVDGEQVYDAAAGGRRSVS